ncbi:MAG TPA: NAD(P) transhydrogenase subunit alpha [Puia sp.]|nr:NAD(P) transhydrogenase subunit alpha [Puia sp.]
MIVGVLKEPPYESRVSLLAEGAAVLVKRKLEVWVEKGAGEKAYCPDTAYSSAGARLTTRDEIMTSADLILGIHSDEIPASLQNKILIGVYQPLYKASLMADWAKRRLTIFSLDMLPRTTRAQNMDVLSSQASIAGYKAVLLAANSFPRYFPMFMTAAGSIAPARALILGAGVAGLQAIATARRLGAVVEVFDTRPAVKEEVMSLGGKFIEVEGAADASGAGGYAVEQSAAFQQQQQEKIAASIARADIVIATAQIPGKKAPVLVSAAMIEAMRPGSVIVDLAAATGGNTELTKNNAIVEHGGVRIIGDSNLPASMPIDASKLYGKNVGNFLPLIIDGENRLNLDFDDELVKGCCITHNGMIVNQRIKN